MNDRLTEAEARKVIEAARIKEQHKALMLRRWRDGDRNARFVVAALAKRRESEAR